MRIHVIPTWREVRNYIERVRQGEAPDECWEQEVVSAHWDRLCCYAPFDLSDRKPKAICDVDTLEKQCDQLKGLDVHALECELRRVVSILPNYDDDDITVAIFPGDPDNAIVNERQNGVVGTSLFGNILIQVNPLISGYDAWIPYVFAHEYHHTVWGNYWFVLHGGELENQFMDSLVIDGEADSFATEIYPNLKPQWLYGIPEAELTALWNRKYREIVSRNDVDYGAYMFGDADSGIPWCAGYAIGFMLVQKYLHATSQSSTDILELHPKHILQFALSESI